MDDLLRVENLSFTYKSWSEAPGKQVLSHLMLSVHEKEKVLLLAPFDAGKSTFARILSGLCPKYLSGTLEGSVTIDDVDVTKSEPWDLVESVGYVSQNPQEQFVASSVEDELAFPLESIGVDRNEMKTRLSAALEKWGLSSLASVSESELSGGERKRVLLALTEMLDPKLWVLDESFDDLDVSWRELLKETIKESGRGILVLASRYLSQFDGLFDRQVMLENGMIVEGNEKAFAHLSGDDLLSSLPPSPVSSSHTVEAKGITVSRTRIGDMEKRQFELSIPSFALRGGERLTLVGANGSGKSTFARLACGLDLPSGGSFSLDGKEAMPTMLQRNVGYLFQNPDLQIFLPTVKEELSWSLDRDKRITKAEKERKVSECADLFGLCLNDTPTTMSYPERKALQAAVYYLLDRPFYILDELDNALTYAKAQMIVRLLQKNGSGLLIITHDREFAALVAEKGFAIQEGRLIAL